MGTQAKEGHENHRLRKAKNIIGTQKTWGKANNIHNPAAPTWDVYANKPSLQTAVPFVIASYFSDECSGSGGSVRLVILEGQQE